MTPQMAGGEVKTWLASCSLCGYVEPVSLTEIIEELPRLSHQERRELCRRVIDLESEQEDMMLCDHIAREGFAMLDRMEAGEESNGQSVAG